MYKQLIIFLLVLITREKLYSQTDSTLPVMPLTLSEAIQRAGADNLTIKEYQLQQQAALADLSLEQAWYLPTLYAGATAHYLNGAAMNTDGKIYRGITQHNFWGGLGVNGDWEPGQHLFMVKAAKWDTASARFQSQAARNQILLKAIITYCDLWATQFKYMALRQLILQSDTLVEQLRIEVQAGLRYQSELLLAETNYQHYRINALKLKVQLLQTSALLAELLHIPQPVQLIPGDSLLPSLRLKSGLPDAALPEIGYLHRPEYQSMQAKFEAIRIRKKMLTIGLFIPNLYAGVNEGVFGPFITPLSNTYALNLGVMWQIPFDRIFNRGELKQYNAALAVQQNRITQFQDKAAEEIASATARLDAAQQSLALARDARQTAAEGLQQSMQRQQLRTAKPYEVFQAQQFYQQTQNDYADAIAAYSKAQYQLYVAMGNDL